MACYFCASESAPFACDWYGVNETLVAAESISADDAWIDAERGRASIVEIIDWNAPGLWFLVEYAPAREGAAARRFWFHRYADEPVLTKRHGACGAAVCESHAREIGTDRHYCKAHWAAWTRLDEREVAA